MSQAIKTAEINLSDWHFRYKISGTKFYAYYETILEQITAEFNANNNESIIIGRLRTTGTGQHDIEDQISVPLIQHAKLIQECYLNKCQKIEESEDLEHEIEELNAEITELRQTIENSEVVANEIHEKVVIYNQPLAEVVNDVFGRFDLHGRVSS